MSIYGCYNKPRQTSTSSYMAQRGWKEIALELRIPDYMRVKSAFGTTDCQYTKTHAADKLCTGCIHQHKD